MALFVFGCTSEKQNTHVSDTYTPGEELPGGDTTNTLLLGTNAFSKPVTNISEDNRSSFFSGNSFFNQAWVEAPASTASRDGLGPLFNARSCATCHFKDGRGQPLNRDGTVSSALLARLAVPDSTEISTPEPHYGTQFQTQAILEEVAEGQLNLTYEKMSVPRPKSDPYELKKPIYSFSDLAYGPMHDEVRMSPRIASAMIGLGLLESIPQERLLELEDSYDENNDGISGRVHWVVDQTDNSNVVGRFGWKAEQPSVKQQSAAAFVNDIGITNEIFPKSNCSVSQIDCAQTPNGGTPEIERTLLDRVSLYASLLAVPTRQRYDDEDTLAGKNLFSTVGCANCHVPNHQTGHSDFPELAFQDIWPYTDLLLHDMGHQLADQIDTLSVSRFEWRTPPLWGLRLIKAVNGHMQLMHDGRADGVYEAVLWHGGEAESSKILFNNLTQEDQNLIVSFVESL